MRTLLLIGIWLATTPMEVDAQESDGKYQLGLRSAVIIGEMDLSSLDQAFGDLDFDGVKGPHISGVFFLYRLRPYLRIGFETLVASSDRDEVTTMNYQAAGPVLDLSYGDPWSIAGGVHVGGLIANAMARQGTAPSEGASLGSFYKGSGGFLAPYMGIGFRFNRNELRLFVKPVITFGDSDRGGLAAFSAWFGGVRYAITL